MTEVYVEPCDPSQLVEVKYSSDTSEVPGDNDVSGATQVPGNQASNQNEPQPPLLVKPKHIRRRRKQMLFCKTCDYTAKTKRSFTRHNLSKAHAVKVKREEKLEKCKTCNVEPKKNDPNVCPQCDYTSENIRSVKLHMSMHNKGLPFKCESCDFAAQNVKLLIEHYKKVTKHCSKLSCKFSTHSAAELKAHKKICTW